MDGLIGELWGQCLLAMQNCAILACIAPVFAYIALYNDDNKPQLVEKLPI